MSRFFGFLTVFTLGAAAVYACGYGARCAPAGSDEFAQQAAALRAEGPSGLDVALRRLEEAKSEEERSQLSKLVDQVAGQRDATASRLYWYTDLDLAKRAAAESGRPILSLRMLGKLTDEYSCANSRYFRTALYANKEVSDTLRDSFIFHWQSVRPVPRVTVDFGDGRKLERTITGNSAHYILDAAGEPLDALPGLYGPRVFHEWLVRSRDFADRYAERTTDASRLSALKEYHLHRQLVVEEQLRADLAAVAPELLNDPNAASPAEATVMADGRLTPTAMQAARRAVSKSLAEVRLVAPFAPSGETLQAKDDAFWRQIASLHVADAKLDDASRALVAREFPGRPIPPAAPAAGKLSVSKGRVEDPLLRLIGNFQEAMAIDGVKNEYTLHRTIHGWFADGTPPFDVTALNERVYAELFLTPSSDPWLGLAAGDVYTALDNGGLTTPQAAK